jgi:hypothetical protein
MTFIEARDKVRAYASRSYGHAFLVYGGFFAFWMLVFFALMNGPSVGGLVGALVAGVFYGVVMAALHPWFMRRRERS